MDPATIFLRNPRLTLLLIGLVLVAGGSAVSILPRMEDPLLTERAALIITSLPGADAEQVESLVTDRIEDELREVAEIKELRSSSRTSLSTITIELRDDVMEDEAPNLWSRIRDRIADAEVDLPQNASRPRFERIEVTAYTRLIALVPDVPQGQVSSTPPDMPNAILRRKAEELRELLLGVTGTKDVEIFGDPQEEIRVEIDPDRLAGMGLSVAEVSRLIRASDSRFSAGLMRNSQRDLLIEVSGELDSVDRISSVPIKNSADGEVTLLGDVATVSRGVREPVSELSIVNGQPAIVLACLIRPSQRIDKWNTESEQVTRAFSDRLEGGIRLVEVFSQNGYVTDRLAGLVWNLLVGAGSVMVVILLLMGWRSALIVGAALPLSAMMVFAGMNYMDIPIHQMSVTGLIIALGLLIDNAIVVVDEVSQKIRDGQSALQAVRRTVSHLAVPLFGSTFTTALAFAPIVLMPGPAGEFVGSIAINVIVAIFSSLVLSLTVVPALTGFLSAAGRTPQASPSAAETSTVWYRDGVSAGPVLSVYQRLLAFVLRYPVAGIGLGVVLPAAGFVASTGLSEQFFPPADRDQIAIEVELTSQASIAETLATTTRIRDSLLQKPGVEEVTWWVGRSAPPFYYNQIPSRRGMSQYAQALVKLNDSQNLRARINQMQGELDLEYPGAQILVRQLEQGPPFEAPIEVQVFGPDLDQLAEISDRISQLLATHPDVTHIRSEASQLEPRLTLQVDEEKARLLGMTHETVAQQMFSSLEGAVGGMILEGTEELPVRVRVAGSDRSSVDDVESIDVVSTIGPARTGYRGVPLTTLGRAELTPERSSVTRLDRRRMTEVQAFLKAGVLPADVLNDFQQLLAAEETRIERERREAIRDGRIDEIPPPVIAPGYTLAYAGEAAQRDDAVGNLMASVATLAVLMVAALVLSFRSFRLAGLIGVVAMLAVGLGVGALWVFGHPFGFMAIIGTMGLVGVAINDSIVVLAAIQENEDARDGDAAAIADVVVRATRHVVATSLTTIAGFLPLILAGGGFWPPMAVTIAGGVGGATVLALIFVPAGYLLLMKPRLELSSATLPRRSAALLTD